MSVLSTRSERDSDSPDVLKPMANPSHGLSSNGSDETLPSSSDSEWAEDSLLPTLKSLWDTLPCPPPKGLKHSGKASSASSSLVGRSLSVLQVITQWTNIEPSTNLHAMLVPPNDDRPGQRRICVKEDGVVRYLSPPKYQYGWLIDETTIRPFTDAYGLDGFAKIDIAEDDPPNIVEEWCDVYTGH